MTTFIVILIVFGFCIVLWQFGREVHDLNSFFIGEYRERKNKEWEADLRNHHPQTQLFMKETIARRRAQDAGWDDAKTEEYLDVIRAAHFAQFGTEQEQMERTLREAESRWSKENAPS